MQKIRTLINIKQQDIKDNKKDEYQELCSDLPLELIDIFKSNDVKSSF